MRGLWGPRRPARTALAVTLALTTAVGLYAGTASAAPAGPATRPAADRLAVEHSVGWAAASRRAARSTAPRAAAAVRLLGNGFGHGHGLSQWGAQRQAEAGRGHRAILRFYYPRLRQGTSGGEIRVLLTGDTTDDVHVLDRRHLRVGVIGGRTVDLDRTAAARQWRIRASDGGRRSAISWRGTSGGWRSLTTLRGQAQFAAGGRPITLVTPTERRAYRGTLRSVGGPRRDTVNVLPLESYLRGVVPREVFTSWRPAALRAQSVAARSYAAFERADYASRSYHVVDTTASQVYGGATDEAASTDAAIAATARQVLTWRGKPAFTQFSASNGGWTARGSTPYLGARRDPYDDTYRGWTDSVTAAEVQRAFPAIGAFRRISVTERDGHGQWGGRVLAVRLIGARASTTISGETFRSYFGLNSSWFRQR